MPPQISIRGARENNLKNINIDIPKNKLVVITGLSGSGKSSLAFDTIYAEGQRRYAESLSSYARQYMDARKKPDVDKIDGLSPTIAIDQKSHSQNPRSTVGTTTEIYDYLRLLFARLGVQHCTECDVPLSSFTAGQIVEKIKRLAKQNKPIAILAPLLRKQNSKKSGLMKRIEKSGFAQARVNGQICKIHDLLDYKFSSDELYDVELVIGQFTDARQQDVAKMTEQALDLGNGLIGVQANGQYQVFSVHGLCPKCGLTMPAVSVRDFSFNSPKGACRRCGGLGITKEVDPNLVIPNNRLTLAQGAIQPYMRLAGRQKNSYEMLEAVAKENGFSLNMPVKELTSQALDIIMFGTGQKVYDFNGKRATFTGVAHQLTEKYLQTDSDYVRKEIEQYMKKSICPQCQGQRLKKESLAVKIDGCNIAKVAVMDAQFMLGWLVGLEKKLTKGQDKNIARPIIKELNQRLQSLDNVGLGYLTSDRAMNTLSGGEVTRVRLATQLTTGLNGVIYVLDEPSVGLHPSDNSRLIKSLKHLRDLGNTVIVVEHDEDMMKQADYLVDVGPSAGISGGQIVAKGTISQIKKHKNSFTAQFLNGQSQIQRQSSILNNAKKSKPKYLEVVRASGNNLQNINVKIPLNKFVCITGVSGSGKSTLVIDTLGRALSQHFYRAKTDPEPYQAIKGLEYIDKVIAVDQSPIGRTPRSNPATYTNIFTGIRDLYANLPESKMYNYKAGKFSFNVKGGGRCETCAGEGYIRIPMQFLADVFVECSDCGATRYSLDVLEVHYRSRNIADVLNMTADEAFIFFNDIEPIAQKLSILRDVGLGYLRLGQPATTLSGGEAQRIKLATELARVSTGNTLYILDEPTTGLHFEDIKKLLAVLERLVEKGNSVLVIEHNNHVINYSDWVIDLGPQGGAKGGRIVGDGPPDKIAKLKTSLTGRYL
ncbi:MAG: excinuclease ABC subunit UvrA [Candidatus Magasanikbacteria bacterium CG10_big_fil_rev_8_21_14_0_10_40_10]|uniref:UvrABC system protein A n=1 Tax=Candidatus Magasanikbacteria bacterium CG10_big_fil_rev_8_21_14_0_10_40_10 TaxID=1974648 RepID=A0A2M6W4D2_9BACT|nr:MAG: excinuclease ABC subunit UvrA [Candidatus Magasanikbacteria bacterium CG10_big_fil_rev_8_21_14_0_10_40_10]